MFHLMPGMSFTPIFTPRQGAILRVYSPIKSSVYDDKIYPVGSKASDLESANFQERETNSYV